MLRESSVSRVRAAEEASTPPARCLPYFCFLSSSVSAFSLLAASYFRVFPLFIFSSLTLTVLSPPALPALFIHSPSQTSTHPLVSIKQRWMEAPARPVTPSAASGRGLKACSTATHSLVPSKPLPCGAASSAAGKQLLSRKPVAFHYFNILHTFVSQLHHYSKRSPSVIPPSPSQGFFGTLGRARLRPDRRIYHRQVGISLPDPQLVTLVDTSDTCHPLCRSS